MTEETARAVATLLAKVREAVERFREMKKQGEGLPIQNPPIGKASLSLAGDAAELLDVQVQVTADLVEQTAKHVAVDKELVREVKELNEQLGQLQESVAGACEMLAAVLDRMEEDDDE